MNPSTTLSILVPVYNEQYLVCPSLERLKILAESPLLDRIEIIVVDDGSTDDTGAIASGFGERVRVVRSDRNRGDAVVGADGERANAAGR